MLVSVGPFALPLIWWHPETSLKWKIVITTIVLVFTYALWLLSVFVFQLLNDQLETLRSIGV